MSSRRAQQTAAVARRWPAALVLAAVALAYLPSLQNGFSFDDADVITGAADLLGDPAAIGTLVSHDYFGLSYESTYRPLVTLSYMLDWQVGGGGAWAFHVQSVVWHLVSVGCLLVLLPRLGASGTLSWTIAALYGLHPAITEAIDGASFREDALVTAFGLLGLIFSTGALRSGVLRTMASLACVVAACLAKESGVVFAVLWPLTHWTLEQASVAQSTNGTDAGTFIGVLRARRSEYTGLGLCTIGYLILRLVVFASPGHYGVRIGDSLLASVATSLVAIGYYVRLFFVPWPLCADYRGVIPYANSLLDGRVVAACAAIAGLTWIAARSRRSYPLMWWGWLWFLISLVPVSNLVPIPHFMAERFLHLPYVGLATFAATAAGAVLATGTGSQTFRVPRAFVVTAVVVMLGVLGALTWNRHAAWMSNDSLWATTLTDYPTSHGGLQGYAGVLIESGRHAEAVPYLEGVLGSGTASRDRKASVLLDLGYAQSALGALEQARRSFQASIEFVPTSRAYQNLAIASLGLRRFDDAEQEARAAVRLQPDSAEAHSVLGAVFVNQRRSDEAVAEYREALRLRPSLASAQEGLRRLGH